MGIDMILAALAMRHRSWGAEKLVGKAIDLRKAYKNLPLSLEALNDAYICVFDPESSQPRAFQSQVLPFGARAAVMGFCRVSYAIWRIGVVIFRLHWTVFFDDFYLVASLEESKHVDMAQKLFFQLIGWQVSSEKEADFGVLARILGVQIDLNESILGAFTICNVESRVKELVSTIDDILERRSMSSAEMRVLRGRLIFAEAQIFGRLAGLHMQQLGRLEHAVGNACLDEDLTQSLHFLKRGSSWEALGGSLLSMGVFSTFIQVHAMSLVQGGLVAFYSTTLGRCYHSFPPEFQETPSVCSLGWVPAAASCRSRDAK